MALKRTFMIVVLLVCGTLTGTTWGQNHAPGTFFERTPETAQNLPLATPGLFDYDTQLFAPLEFTNGKEKEPNTGFTFTLDRSYISIARAARFNSLTGEQTSNGSEFNWGTNYELGWYGENDTGWNLKFDNLTGSFFTNGEDIQSTNPTHVEQKFATVQLNRMFRQTLSHGGYFEPYLGGRFVQISDDAVQDTGPARFLQDASNSIFGVQAGARFNQRRGRWRFTYNGAIATTYNQQRYESTDLVAGLVTGQTSTSDQSFVPILDGTIEAAYHISRDLSLKLGVQGVYTWNGIARVNTETAALNGNSVTGAGVAFQPLDEDFIAVGFRFGVEWRR